MAAGAEAAAPAIGLSGSAGAAFQAGAALRAEAADPSTADTRELVTSARSSQRIRGRAARSRALQQGGLSLPDGNGSRAGVAGPELCRLDACGANLRFSAGDSHWVRSLPFRALRTSILAHLNGKEP